MSIKIVKDPNLKYAIIAVLNKQDLLLDEAEKIKQTKSYSREFKSAPFHSFIKEVVDYYDNIELTNEILSKISVFNPRGTERCYRLLLKEWDGEDDTFHIHSLEGIELLPAMEVFAPDYFLMEECDLSPLLKCPALNRVRIDSIPESNPNAGIFDELRKKGIELYQKE